MCQIPEGKGLQKKFCLEKRQDYKKNPDRYLKKQGTKIWKSIQGVKSPAGNHPEIRQVFS